MSFFTWRWLLPQKLQRSCSLPSVARAIFGLYLCFSVSSTAGSYRQRVVDRETGVHRAARRVAVNLDVLVRVVGLEVDHLGDDEVRHIVVDRRAKEDDPLLQHPRVDVAEALSAGGLLDDTGDD